MWLIKQISNILYTSEYIENASTKLSNISNDDLDNVFVDGEDNPIFNEFDEKEVPLEQNELSSKSQYSEMINAIKDSVDILKPYVEYYENNMLCGTTGYTKELFINIQKLENFSNLCHWQIPVVLQDILTYLECYCKIIIYNLNTLYVGNDNINLDLQQFILLFKKINHILMSKSEFISTPNLLQQSYELQNKITEEIPEAVFVLLTQHSSFLTCCVLIITEITIGIFDHLNYKKETYNIFDHIWEFRHYANEIGDLSNLNIIKRYVLKLQQKLKSQLNWTMIDFITFIKFYTMNSQQLKKYGNNNQYHILCNILKDFSQCLEYIYSLFAKNSVQLTNNSDYNDIMNILFEGDNGDLLTFYQNVDHTQQQEYIISCIDDEESNYLDTVKSSNMDISVMNHTEPTYNSVQNVEKNLKDIQKENKKTYRKKKSKNANCSKNREKFLLLPLLGVGGFVIHGQLSNTPEKNENITKSN